MPECDKRVWVSACPGCARSIGGRVREVVGKTSLRRSRASWCCWSSIWSGSRSKLVSGGDGPKCSGSPCWTYWTRSSHSISPSAICSPFESPPLYSCYAHYPPPSAPEKPNPRWKAAWWKTKRTYPDPLSNPRVSHRSSSSSPSHWYRHCNYPRSYSHNLDTLLRLSTSRFPKITCVPKNEPVHSNPQGQINYPLPRSYSLQIYHSPSPKLLTLTNCYSISNKHILVCHSMIVLSMNYLLSFYI